MDEQCPCINCVCIAMCRYKYFVDLKIGCSLVAQYLYETRVDSNHLYSMRRSDFDYNIYQVYLAINPTEWSKEGAEFKWKKRAHAHV